MSYTIQQVPTRILLREVQEHNRFRHGEPWLDATKVLFQKRITFHARPAPGGNGWDYAVATYAEAVAELESRPHLPSKKEGKVLRRLMQENPGWTAEQLRAHPRFGMEIADAQYPNRTEISAAHAMWAAPRYGKVFGKLFKVV